MLKLLLATRLRYYRNFLRAHFDRITLIELGGIFLILFFLTLRSPTDIGYSLSFLLAPDFSQKWSNLWTQLLPLYYLIAEVVAFFTLRASSEMQILGTLPVSPRALLPYQLARHFSKTIFCLPSQCGAFSFGQKQFGNESIHNAHRTGGNARCTIARVYASVRVTPTDFSNLFLLENS